MAIEDFLFAVVKMAVQRSPFLPRFTQIRDLELGNLKKMGRRLRGQGSQIFPSKNRFFEEVLETFWSLGQMHDKYQWLAVAHVCRRSDMLCFVASRQQPGIFPYME